MSNANPTRDDQTTLSAETPIYAEELVPEKRVEQVGTVHVHKDVIEEPQTVTAEVTRDEMKVERTPMNQEVTDLSTDVFQQEDIEIPLQAETLTADKRVVQTEEVTLEKQQVTEQAQVTGTVRREQVVVDEAAVAPAPPVSTGVAAVPSTSSVVEDASTTTGQGASVRETSMDVSTPTSTLRGESAVLSDGQGRSAQVGEMATDMSTVGAARTTTTVPTSTSLDEMDSGTPIQSEKDARQWRDEPEETILIRAGTPTGDESATDRAEFVAGEGDAQGQGSTGSSSPGASDAANKAKGVAKTIGSEVAGAASTVGDRIGGALGKLTGHEQDKK